MSHRSQALSIKTGHLLFLTDGLTVSSPSGEQTHKLSDTPYPSESTVVRH